MKLNNLRKYASLNILSLLGYPILLLFLYIILVITPADWADIAGYHYDYDMVGYASSVIFGLYVFIIFVTVALFLLAAFIECIVRYADKTEFSLLKKIPHRFKLLYTIMFWLGLLFSLTPVLYFFAMYIEPLQKFLI